MRALRLRTQLAIVAIFLICYGAAVGLSYRIQMKAQAALEASFSADLAVLTRLPRLSDDLRHLALLTSQYLLSGDARWLEERSRVVTRVRRSAAELEGMLSEPREHEAWESLQRRLSSYLAEQERWIERRESGRLSLANAVRIGGERAGFDELIDRVAAVRDQNVSVLKRRREAALRAAQATFYLTLATGLFVAGLLTLFLSIYVIGPVARLESYARAWSLGSPWELRDPPVGPELQSLFACLRDMARRLNEDFLRQQEIARFKSQLVSVVSHEFNNALGIIGGAAQALESSEGVDNPKKRAGFYAMLKANVKALHVVAENLLNTARQEEGRFTIDLEAIDLRRVAQQALNQIEVLALRKSILLSFEAPERLVIEADGDALSLAITNLIGNAIKYTAERGRVSVRLELEPSDPSMARISVSDTGIGIRPEDRERIFSGFYRTEQGRKAAKGFGVGLPLVRRIVEAHEGRLEVESEPGKGSTFRMLLPVKRGRGAEVAHESTA